MLSLGDKMSQTMHLLFQGFPGVVLRLKLRVSLIPDPSLRLSPDLIVLGLVFGFFCHLLMQVLAVLPQHLNEANPRTKKTGTRVYIYTK